MPKVEWIEIDSSGTYVDRTDEVASFDEATTAVERELYRTANESMTNDILAKWHSKSHHPQRWNGVEPTTGFKVSSPNGSAGTTVVCYTP